MKRIIKKALHLPAVSIRLLSVGLCDGKLDANGWRYAVVAVLPNLQELNLKY